MKTLITKLGLALVLSTTVVGCANTEEVKEEVSQKEQVKEEALKTIGTKSENAKKILLENKTGSEITSLVVVNTTTSEESENLLSDGYASDQKREFYYEFIDGQAYDIRVSVGDNEYTIHGFPIDIEAANLCFEEGVAYLEYTDVNGESVNTKETELTYVQQQAVSQETQQAPAQQETVVQAPVQQAPVQQAPVQQAPVEQAPVQAPVQQDTQVTQPQAEGCLNGLFDE